MVWRETTATDWQNVIPVGDVTTATIDLAKDNVQFGIRAVQSTAIKPVRRTGAGCLTPTLPEGDLHVSPELATL